ncbi:MAG TPA: CBS domain-containing protein [Acidimicrobiia bacterium]|nr:CBS domain-containing protein [Acidimicrobiia bacterium]
MTIRFLPTAARGLVSVAGLAGRPVRNPAGAEIGRVVDVVARWDGAPYPPVTGVLARVGRRRAFVPAEALSGLDAEGVDLSSARLSLTDFERRDGELLLLADVVDHQMVDVDGVRVIRASDLYLARVGAGWRLVGVDVGLQTLARRLGPARWRGRPTPGRVIDWSAIQPFGGPGPIRLRRTNQELHRLRPAELADLLEDLGRRERDALLGALGPETAADALEEMDAAELGVLLRETPAADAAPLVAEMEPDEAAEALRSLNEEDRSGILAAMPAGDAERLRELLAHPEGTAGGLMTTVLVTAGADETVAGVRERLRGEVEHREEIDAVLVVDDDGRLVDDVSVFELLLAAPDTRLGDLVAPPWPVVVDAGAPVEDVVEGLIDNRRSSVVVVDGLRRPIGRILADDVVDALVPGRGRRHFPRLLS